MDYNLLNGGLVLKVDEKFVISDMKSFTTTFRTETDGMFWFMNADGTSIYYSDQKRGNALCRMDIARQREELVLDKPCYGVFYHQDWLYYINEEDRKLYRCLTNGKRETRLSDDQVNCFILKNARIYYTTPKGIRSCNETGGEREVVNDAVAASLMLIGNKLLFTDNRRRQTLNILDLNTDSTLVVDEMAASSMNTDGSYLYCSNRLNDNSIYRVDPESSRSIRICGESAEYLHVIDHDLYFCIDREWHTMSLTGGPFEKLMR